MQIRRMPLPATPEGTRGHPIGVLAARRLSTTARSAASGSRPSSWSVSSVVEEVAQQPSPRWLRRLRSNRLETLTYRRSVSGRDDDEAWRAIVENYGERAQVDEPLPVTPDPAPPEPFQPTYDELGAKVEPEERFVPPPPPPAPRIELPRHLPWLGVLGIPVLLLVLLLAGLGVPSWLGYLLVAGFVGSFVYLVLHMKPGGRDPWDNGAQV